MCSVRGWPVGSRDSSDALLLEGRPCCCAARPSCCCCCCSLPGLVGDRAFGLPDLSGSKKMPACLGGDLLLRLLRLLPLLLMAEGSAGSFAPLKAWMG